MAEKRTDAERAADMDAAAELADVAPVGEQDTIDAGRVAMPDVLGPAPVDYNDMSEGVAAFHRLADGVGAVSSFLRVAAEQLGDAVGPPSYKSWLFGVIDEDGLTFYVYGTNYEIAQRMSAFRETLGGQWLDHASGDQLFSEQTFTNMEFGDMLTLELVNPVKVTLHATKGKV